MGQPASQLLSICYIIPTSNPNQTSPPHHIRFSTSLVRLARIPFSKLSFPSTHTEIISNFPRLLPCSSAITRFVPTHCIGIDQYISITRAWSAQVFSLVPSSKMSGYYSGPYPDFFPVYEKLTADHGFGFPILTWMDAYDALTGFHGSS